MRTDDPLDLSEYYAQRGRVLQELGALRDFARLRNRREWQWRRLWLDSGDSTIIDSTKSGVYPRIKHLAGLISEIKNWRPELNHYDLRAYIRDRKYAWQR